MKQIIFSLYIIGATLMAQSLHGEWKRIDTTSKATITFDSTNNSVSGFSGCNRFHTTYSTYEGAISFGHFSLTRKMCAKEIMQQERSFMVALSQIKLFSIDHTTLSLFDAFKKVKLQFKYVPSPQ